MTFNGSYHPEPSWWNDLVAHVDLFMVRLEARIERLLHWRD